MEKDTTHPLDAIEHMAEGIFNLSEEELKNFDDKPEILAALLTVANSVGYLKQFEMFQNMDKLNDDTIKNGIFSPQDEARVLIKIIKVATNKLKLSLDEVKARILNNTK